MEQGRRLEDSFLTPLLVDYDLLSANEWDA